jgi:hypothetical protein
VAERQDEVMNERALQMHESTAERDVDSKHIEQRGPTSMVVPKAVEPASHLASAVDLPPSQLQPQRFAYHLLVPRAAFGAVRLRLIEAYACWRSVWETTLRELDNADRVFSDDFTRQDELGALFYADRCVGLTGYRWVDLSLPGYRDDSYFKVWPRTALETALGHGSRICVGSNLTVLPQWRGALEGYSVKEILMTLAVRRFLASDADAMLGTMRNDRGMNHLVYRLGARPVLQNVSHHGVQVDLVTFARHAMGPIEPGHKIDLLTQALWRDVSRQEAS